MTFNIKYEEYKRVNVKNKYIRERHGKYEDQCDKTFKNTLVDRYHDTTDGYKI